MLVVEHAQIKYRDKGKEPQMPHTKRILCADHDLDTCGMIVFLLGLEGYEVKIATKVGDALRMAQSERFNLYLLDDLFEDGAGLELLASIRTFDRERPVIIYSAEGRESARRKSIVAQDPQQAEHDEMPRDDQVTPSLYRPPLCVGRVFLRRF